jgi:hypothetical protein
MICCCLIVFLCQFQNIHYYTKIPQHFLNPRLISSSTDYFHMILIVSWASGTAHTKSLPSICWCQGCCTSICTCLWNIVCIYLCAKWSVHHGELVETLQHLYPNYPIPTKLKKQFKSWTGTLLHPTSLNSTYSNWPKVFFL